MTVTPDDLEEDERGILLFEGVPFTGIAERLADGKLVLRWSYSDGIRNGMQREWYVNGQLAYEEDCYQNGTHGYCRVWFRNGQLRAETLGELGSIIYTKIWNESGELMSCVQIELSQNEINQWRKRRADALARGILPPPEVDQSLLP